MLNQSNIQYSVNALRSSYNIQTPLLFNINSYYCDKGTQRFIVFYMHHNVYSEVPSKEHRTDIASKFTISYQNKDFKTSNVSVVILSQIR